MSPNNENEFKGRLIAAVKKEVKQVMEESVTRKFVHEESGSVTSLCAAVEACLSQGLRRRALGLFKTSSTTALLHKIAKHSKEAALISKKVQEIENADPTRRSSSSSESMNKPTLKKNHSLPSNPLPKYLWIRLALFEKQLAKIIDYLVSNANKYYDKDALVADPDYGSILSSLLVGPCALDYSRTKTPDHFWTDPPADELVQRHRISSGHSTPPSVRRPILNFRRSLNASSDDSIANRTNTQHLAKDYVESLHQNSRATLLFGKNNVLVLPVNADVSQPMPGYLSLHQTASGLTIKWTPNQLMNGFTDEVQDKSVFWDYALQVRLDEIVYVHCHQDSETGGTVILVGQDGVQRPPIHFPKGGHMLAFLSCIETGLLPRGRLDPPLWSQRSGSHSNKRRRPLPALSETEETTKDYVFRIADNSTHKDMYPPLSVTIANLISNSQATWCLGITMEKWNELCKDGVVSNFDEVYRLTYFGGVAHELRKDLWPYLLGHYKFGSTTQQRLELSEETKQAYENTMSEWLAVEAIVRQRDKETQANAIAKLSSESMSGEQVPAQIQRDLSNEVFEDMLSDEDSEEKPSETRRNTIRYESDGEVEEVQVNTHEELKDFIHNVIVTNASVDMGNLCNDNDTGHKNNLDVVAEENSSLDACIEAHGLASPARSACVSPASSNGGVYSQELLETFGLNLHRIEKDVQRCDRNYWYFTVDNLEKLRNVMCTYVWEHLDIGYMQGMCDLVAPLLVVFNDESLTYACFCHLMERMVENFPNGNAMDCHFANMRSLIQILDSEMYELMHSHGDYTHFYFCYRWFLLDFKRELVYSDVYATWEVIWAAQHVASSHFVLFLALALLETYRDIILSNCMDFTDIIKFFNEMAERHNASAVLSLARDLVLQLQLLIENK
ncbi:small G protein signaling modulator 2-like [Tribolium madens]|uniref:small G protein signaling modulator 2-like n=1 Tax=Tribolium madens TaxID=41895 RepID=UPI001CF76465|nr:small G protein signaling modulator 2-like [Tribolium madens]